MQAIWIEIRLSFLYKYELGVYVYMYKMLIAYILSYHLLSHTIRSDDNDLTNKRSYDRFDIIIECTRNISLNGKVEFD